MLCEENTEYTFNAIKPYNQVKHPCLSFTPKNVYIIYNIAQFGYVHIDNVFTLCISLSPKPDTLTQTGRILLVCRIFSSLEVLFSWYKCVIVLCNDIQAGVSKLKLNDYSLPFECPSYLRKIIAKFSS